MVSVQTSVDGVTDEVVGFLADAANQLAQRVAAASNCSFSSSTIATKTATFDRRSQWPVDCLDRQSIQKPFGRKVPVHRERIDRIINQVAAVVAICAGGAIIAVSVLMFTVLRAPTGVQANWRGTSSNRPEPIAEMDAVEIGMPEISLRASGSIVLVEFSDYECPFCRLHAQQTMTRLRTALEPRL
jgi:hypothetical protein